MMLRRTFLSLPAALAVAIDDLASFDKARVVKAADTYLKGQPATVTAAHSDRSAGGLHDFFSEGDYWWPDPKNADAPYVQRDGMSNPENFTRHREFLLRLSVEVPALAAAWNLTSKKAYAEHAAKHLLAWFVNVNTRMNPNLLYSQAIHGRFTGRGIGIIDTIHLVEVAQAIPFVRAAGALTENQFAAVQQWFADYLKWMTTHKYGLDEMEAKNNHGTCWNMQVAAFAKLTGNAEWMASAGKRWKEVLLPAQMAEDGSFPQELHRTKPYSYSLFNLDAMATTCQILSTKADNLWAFTLPDGRGMSKGVAYMAPFIADKKTWPLKPDVMYFDEWPMRHPSLLFAAVAYKRSDYMDTWKRLPADAHVLEVIRNFFVRQPVLWV